MSNFSNHPASAAIYSSVSIGFGRLFGPMARVLRGVAALAIALFAANAGDSATLDFESSFDSAMPAPFQPQPGGDEGGFSATLTGELLSASEFLTKGDAATAERIALQVTANEPKNPDAWFLLGLALANLDRLEEALEPLARASDLYQQNAAPLVVMGDILASLGRVDDAEAAYERAVERDPTNWAAQESLGLIAERKGDSDLAAERYAKASMTAPGNRLFPRLQLARLALLGDDPDLAISVLSPIAFAGHREDRLFDLLARAYLEKGDTDSARRYLSKLVEGGNSVFGYVGLARIALTEGDGPEAARLMSEAIGKWPSDRALAVEHGNVLGAIGRYPEALAVYDGLLADDPEDIGLLRSRGLTLSRLDRADEALETARVVVALDGAGSGDYVRLGSLLESSDDLPGAIATYETAVERDPENWIALNNLSALLSSSDPSRAVGLATAAATLAPEVPAVQDTLAWAIFKSGDIGRAAQIYEGLLKAAPDDPSLLYRLGAIRMAEGRTDEGRAMIEAALKADPDFAYSEDAKAILEQN